MEQVVARLKRYPPEAYAFLRDGLEWTVRSRHGAPPKGWMRLVRWMSRQNVGPDELCRRHREGRLPRTVGRLLDKMGGPAALESRHVSGAELCHGLRELALARWGYLAGSVLRCWNIHGTRDFGEMVFAMIDAEMLQKRDEDRIEDFDDVFAFQNAFERSYRIRLPETLE